MPSEAGADTHEQEYTLDALAFRLEPQIYHDWKRELESRRLAALDSDLGMFGRMEAAAYLEDLRHGTQHSETAKQERRFAELQNQLHEAVRNVIASPNARTQGVRPDGELADVHRSIAKQLKIDLENSTLSTTDGGVIWRAVVVRTAAPSQVAPATEVHSDAWLRGEMVRRAGSGEPKDRDTMVVVLRREFPHIGERAARAMFTNLPGELKERPGPKVAGQKTKKRSGTTVPE